MKATAHGTYFLPRFIVLGTRQAEWGAYQQLKFDPIEINLVGLAQPRFIPQIPVQPKFTATG
jgi:hypothetical protein